MGFIIADFLPVQEKIEFPCLGMYIFLH